MTDAESLLRQAELDAEKTSAVIRLIVFLFLALAIFTAADLRGAAASPAIATGLYGAGAGAGALLAWRRVFHPVMPYLFVTFDMLLAVAQLELLAGMMGMRPSSAFHLPASVLIFVFLIHAAMRYRPWLVGWTRRSENPSLQRPGRPVAPE